LFILVGGYDLRFLTGHKEVQSIIDSFKFLPKKYRLCDVRVKVEKKYIEKFVGLMDPKGVRVKMSNRGEPLFDTADSNVEKEGEDTFKFKLDVEQGFLYSDRITLEVLDETTLGWTTIWKTRYSPPWKALDREIDTGEGVKFIILSEHIDEEF
jgi:hypothetical protein